MTYSLVRGLPLPLLVLLSLALTGDASAQSPASAPAPCAGAAHREFDFWLGEWKVLNPKAQPAGSSKVTSILGGCVILEEWTGAQGPSVGKSFNIYDAATKRWHQSWVDNGGQLALFDGGLVDGRMVLEGPAIAPDGRPLRTRMTFTPLPDGRVRQLWENSADGGTTSKTAFDGYYSRVK
ncbi:MAG: hypothetical protein ABIZ91_02680 [Gemmatimonadaceae bacterium]